MVILDMLDINLFREEKGYDPMIIKNSQLARGSSVEIVDEIIQIDKLCRSIQYEIEQYKKQLNIVQRDISVMIKNGEDVTTKLKEKNKLDETIKNIRMIDEPQKRLQEKLFLVGNIVHQSVPVDNDEERNQVVRLCGNIPQYNFNLRGHYDVMKKLDIVDTERGVKIAGHRGYFLKDYGVLLNQALINYGLAFLRGKGYTILQPPFFMFRDVVAKTVQLSDYDENLYKLVSGNADDENTKYLIATSEQPISAYHMDEFLSAEDMPIKYCGLSPCFRKEAGSHGKDIQGIFRVHQFEKIEQFCITTPEKSWEMFEEMIKISEEFYQSLGLHYRIVNIVSGALNNAAAKKYDLEAWFPESNKFRELVSCSNCTNYQSVSMNIKVKYTGKNAKNKEFVHCLNSTLCATERTICCLAETYQTENGMVIPQILRPYMGTDFIPYRK